MSLRRVFPQFVEQADADNMLRRIFNVVAVMHKVTVFDVGKSDGEDFDKAILDTVTNNLRPLLKPAANDAKKKQFKLGAEYELYMDVLRLALTFDRVDEATAMLVSARLAWESMTFEADTSPETSKYRDRLGTLEKATEEKAIKGLVAEIAAEFKDVYGLAYLNQAFDIQMPLALLWALQTNCVDEVEVIVAKGGIDIVSFIYGTPVSLDDDVDNTNSPTKLYRGYMLDQLYNYDAKGDPYVAEYLKVLLKEKQKGLCSLFACKDNGGSAYQQPEKAADRMALVWNLQAATRQRLGRKRRNTRAGQDVGTSLGAPS